MSIEYYKARSTKPVDQKPKPKDQVNMDFGLRALSFVLWAWASVFGLWTCMDLNLMPKVRTYLVLLEYRSGHYTYI